MKPVQSPLQASRRCQQRFQHIPADQAGNRSHHSLETTQSDTWSSRDTERQVVDLKVAGASRTVVLRVPGHDTGNRVRGRVLQVDPIPRVP